MSPDGGADSFLKKFEKKKKKKNLMNTAASTKDPNQHTNICPKLAMNTHLLSVLTFD